MDSLVDQIKTLLPKYKEATGHDDNILDTYSSYLRDTDKTKYLKTLKKIRNEEYGPLYEHTEVHFTHYMYTTYGIEIQYNENGMITTDYTIVDEKKYTIFCLKF